MIPKKDQRKPSVETPRPVQQTPAEVIHDLLSAARQFYGDCPEKWHADQHFIKKNVILWPASWLNNLGITLSPERYKEIIMGVFMGIKQNSRQQEIAYIPGYLMKCVQTHFNVNKQQYYDEAKALRNSIERVMLAVGKLPTQNDNFTTEMSRVHAALQQPKRLARKQAAKPQKQLGLGF